MYTVNLLDRSILTRGSPGGRDEEKRTPRSAKNHNELIKTLEKRNLPSRDNRDDTSHRHEFHELQVQPFLTGIGIVAEHLGDHILLTFDDARR
jgi:hypothetical protein